MSLVDGRGINRIKPDSIAIGELAIAASAAGFPMTLTYRYFDAHLLRELWCYHLEQVGRERVLHVRRERDIRQLKELGQRLRLILVSHAQLYSDTAWTALLQAKASGCYQAIFCQFSDRRDPDDDPGTTLVLHGRHGEPSNVAAHLAASRALPIEPIPTHFVGSIAFDAALATVIDETLPRPRDRQVVRSLLAGQYVLQSQRGAQRPEECHKLSLAYYSTV